MSTLSSSKLSQSVISGTVTSVAPLVLVDAVLIVDILVVVGVLTSVEEGVELVVLDALSVIPVVPVLLLGAVLFVLPEV